jgi:hypothetical protein
MKQIKRFDKLTTKQIEKADPMDPSSDNELGHQLNPFDEL